MTDAEELPSGWDEAAVKEPCGQPQYGYTESATHQAVGPKFLRITGLLNALLAKQTELRSAANRDGSRAGRLHPALLAKAFNGVVPWMSDVYWIAFTTGESEPTPTPTEEKKAAHTSDAPASGGEEDGAVERGGLGSIRRTMISCWSAGSESPVRWKWRMMNLDCRTD